MKFCSFFGGEDVFITDKWEQHLRVLIKYFILIEDVDVFFFGNKSSYVNLCYNIVTEYKKYYPHIKRIALPENDFIIQNSKSSSAKKVFFMSNELKQFEEMELEIQIHLYGLSNRIDKCKYFIDKSDFCIFFKNNNFIEGNIYAEQERAIANESLKYAQNNKKYLFFDNSIS